MDVKMWIGHCTVSLLQNRFASWVLWKDRNGNMIIASLGQWCIGRPEDWTNITTHTRTPGCFLRARGSLVFPVSKA